MKERGAQALVGSLGGWAAMAFASTLALTACAASRSPGEDGGASDGGPAGLPRPDAGRDGGLPDGGSTYEEVPPCDDEALWRLPAVQEPDRDLTPTGRQCRRWYSSLPLGSFYLPADRGARQRCLRALDDVGGFEAGDVRDVGCATYSVQRLRDGGRPLAFELRTHREDGTLSAQHLWTRPTAPEADVLVGDRPANFVAADGVPVWMTPDRIHWPGGSSTLLGLGRTITSRFGWVHYTRVTDGRVRLGWLRPDDAASGETDLGPAEMPAELGPGLPWPFHAHVHLGNRIVHFRWTYESGSLPALLASGPAIPLDGPVDGWAALWGGIIVVQDGVLRGWRYADDDGFVEVEGSGEIDGVSFLTSHGTLLVRNGQLLRPSISPELTLSDGVALDDPRVERAGPMLGLHRRYLVGRQGLFLRTSSLPSSASSVNSWGPSEASWDALVEGEVVDLRADLNVVVVLLVLDPDGTYRLVVVGEGYRDCEP